MLWPMLKHEPTHDLWVCGFAPSNSTKRSHSWGTGTVEASGSKGQDLDTDGTCSAAGSAAHLCAYMDHQQQCQMGYTHRKYTLGPITHL